MKKTVQIIFISFFIIFLLVPVGAMAVLGESAPVANEIQSSRPVFSVDGKLNVNYLSQLTDYLADRFAFRQEMITLWAEINSSLFNTSTEEQVILGKNGWLYFSDTLDDYRGISLNSKQLDIIVGNLSLLQEFVETNGGKFVFTVAPNKNSLYSQYMPARVENSHENSNLALISDRLNSGLNYADLYSMFSQLEEVCYYKTDTHWTTYGAALGADLILKTAGVDSAYADAGFMPDGKHTGDLFEMLYPAKSGNEDKYICDSVGNFSAINDTKDGNALKFNTENINESGRLFCWRDSFGISLYPYLAEKYAEAQFMRSPAYNLFTCGSFDDTTVIIELVERNLGYIISNTPRFSAPQRSAPVISSQGEPVSCVFSGSESFDALQYRMISCDIVSGNNEPDNRVYFACGDNVYEAYLLSAGDTVTACAWIDESILPDSIIYMIDGNYVSCRLTY